MAAHIGDLFMAFEFEIEAVFHDQTDAPIIEYNDKKFELKQGRNTIKVVSIPGQKQIELVWKNKAGSDTICDANGNIIADKYLKITNCWADYILLEPWFITECLYYPQYFEGINGPAEIKSPFQLSFPGVVIFNYENDFWPWYKEKRISFKSIKNLDKDPDRVWKFEGSYDLFPEVVEELDALITGEGPRHK